MNSVNEMIFEKYYDGERISVPFGDLPKDLLDTDNITINTKEAFYTENNSHNGCTYLRIFRIREKTPEEKATEKEFFTKLKEKSKKERFKKYQELKKEFENE